MRKKIRLLASLLMVSLLAAGCGSSDKFMATESAMATEDYAVEEEKAFDEMSSNSGAVNADITEVNIRYFNGGSEQPKADPYCGP